MIFDLPQLGIFSSNINTEALQGINKEDLSLCRSKLFFIGICNCLIFLQRKKHFRKSLEKDGRKRDFLTWCIQIFVGKLNSCNQVLYYLIN